MRVDDERLAAWADRGAIAVVLRALVANALEALGHGGTIEIAVMPAVMAADVATVDAVAADTVTDDAVTGEPRQAVAIRVAMTGQASRLPCGRESSTLSSRAEKPDAGSDSDCRNAGAS